jgi:glycosyltransferase involved in cell wall biosynthesis
MRIIWIADFSTTDRSGGAQLTNKRMIDYGREQLKLDIVEVNLKNANSLEDLLDDKNNFYIINNYVNLYQQIPYLIGKLTTRKYIRYVHDYDSVYGTIPFRIIHDMFKNALLNIFLSPLHLRITKESNINVGQAYIIPSPVDIDRFEAKAREPRQSGTIIYAGEIDTHKGINNIINFALMNPDKKLDIYGWFGNKELLRQLPKNVEYKKPVNYDELPDLYCKYDYAIHLPVWYEPFGRSIAEQFYTGCRVITNDMVGFMSYMEKGMAYNELKTMITNAPRVFWSKVKESYDQAK